MSPELLITLAGLIAERDRHGTEWCRKFGVGARRAILADMLSGRIVPLSNATAQREAAEVLQVQCSVCRKCVLGRT